VDVIWTVNPQKQLGTVAGTLMVTAFDVVGDNFVRWDGRLTGRVSPDGIGGVVQLKATTGQTFTGTWVSLSSLADIIQDIDTAIAVTGTVRS